MVLYAAVLFLRSTKNTPDLMTIEMRTPGGNVEFDVPVMNVKNYTIDELFEKKLFFLIPFYISESELPWLKPLFGIHYLRQNYPKED